MFATLMRTYLQGPQILRDATFFFIPNDDLPLFSTTSTLAEMPGSSQKTAICKTSAHDEGRAYLSAMVPNAPWKAWHAAYKNKRPVENMMRQLVSPHPCLRLSHAKCALQSEAQGDIDADEFYVLLDELLQDVAGWVPEAYFDLAISAARATMKGPTTDATDADDPAPLSTSV